MSIVLYHSYTLAWNYNDPDIRRLRIYTSLLLVLGIGLGVVIPQIDIPSPPTQPVKWQTNVEKVTEKITEVEWIPPPLPQTPEQRTEPPAIEKQPTFPLPPPNAVKIAKSPKPPTSMSGKAIGAAAFKDTFGDLGLGVEVKRDLKVTTKLSRGGTSSSTVKRNILNSTQIVEASSGIDHIKLNNTIGTTQLTQRSITPVNSEIASLSTVATTPIDKPTRNQEDIVMTMEKLKGRVNRIYTHMLNKDPTIAGKVEFELKIAASGKVISVTVISSTLNSAILQSKVVTILRSLNFGAKNVPTVTISYPLDFVPE